MKSRKLDLKEKISETYYTASQARAVLGLTDDAFQGWIKAGKVSKTMLPGRKQGVYLKRDINFLAASIESALLTVKSPAINFVQATQDNQQDEFELAVLNFGEKSARFHEKRRELLAKNPDMSYYLYDGDFMAGSINIVPIDATGIEEFKNGERGWLLGNHVEQFVSGKPLDCIIIDMMTNTLVPANKRMQYAMHLLFGMTTQLETWGERGIEIAHLYACGGTPDGRRILKTAGFTYLGEPRPGRFMYELDIAQSKLNILEPYKVALTRWKQRHQ